jgi:heme-degrading monooxygenase HmoA
MHAAINRIRVPAEYAARLEQAFSTAAAKMAGVPGFRSFKFLRREGGGEYVVFTEWDDYASFQAWSESDSFSRVHGAIDTRSPIKTDLTLYDVLIEQ